MNCLGRSPKYSMLTPPGFFGSFVCVPSWLKTAGLLIEAIGILLGIIVALSLNGSRSVFCPPTSCF
jgi:hypothetical protein